MGRTLGICLLFAAFSSFALAQTANTTIMTTTTPVPSATAGQPMSGALPMPAPPEATLPGSGTPVGTAPEVGVNDARTGGTGATVQPGVSDLTVGGQRVVPMPVQVTTPVTAPQNTAEPYTSNVPLAGPQSESTTAAPAENAAAATTPTVPARYSVGTVVTSIPQATRQMSLGEVAAQLRNRKLTKHTFDNNDVAALRQQAPNGLRSASEDLPQSDQPVTARQRKDSNNKALDQNDLRKVEDAVKRSKAKKEQEANQPK